MKISTKGIKISGKEMKMFATERTSVWRLAMWCCVWLMTATVEAREVTAQEAEAKARQFFAEQQTASGHMKVKAREADVERVTLNADTRRRLAPGRTHEAEAFYIFNRTDEKGFVIVSGESDMQEVLAYSLENEFVADAIEGGAEVFLRHYAEEVQLIREGRAKVAPSKVIKTGQKLLLKTVNLDQSGAFFNNKYAPESNGKSCMAGCGPVAMATLMAYHRWPENPGTGSETYNTATAGLELTCDFEAEEAINWDLINGKITSGSKASDECSRLLYQCGVAIHSDYLPNNTNSYLSGLVYAFRKVFHYDYCNHIVRESLDGDDDWDLLIINELNNDRPAIVAAQGGLNKWDRHIFVVDGYDATGRYHYNMGWGGTNNGYYADGKISSSNLYLCDELLYGVQPRTTDEPQGKEKACITMKNLRLVEWMDDMISGSKPHPVLESVIQKGKYYDVAAFYLENCYHRDLDGQLRVELHGADGKQKAVVSQLLDIKGLQPAYYYYWFYLTINIPATVSLRPTDYLCLSYRWSGSSTWEPIYCFDDETSYVPVNREAATSISSLPADYPSASSSTDHGIYDLQGRKLQSTPSQGIYIHEGKKRVAGRP